MGPNRSVLTIAIRSAFVFGLVTVVWLGWSSALPRSAERRWYREQVPGILAADTTDEDTTDVDLPWPNTDPIIPTEEADGISIPLPDNIQYHIEYNPETGMYEVVQTIGDDLDFRRGSLMTLDEYLDYDITENLSEYWNEIQQEEDEASRDFAPTIKVNSDVFEGIFRGDEIEIRPQGSAEITFGINNSRTDNPRIPEKQRSITTFDFDQKIQLNVVGKIGEAMQLNVNYNTESTFDFENQMKLEYTGDEDQIIQKIELGNVSMPLQGTLIQGNQSLFGAKFETKWGKLRNTTVFSQQKGEKKEIDVQGGAQAQKFEIGADNYEANKHYFLSGYWRAQYDQAMASLPVVSSGANITRIEVWMVNTQANTQDVRNFVAFTDIGEHPDYISSDLTDGEGNDIYNDPNLAITLNGNPNNLNNDIYTDATNNPDVMDFTNAVTAVGQMYPYMIQGAHYERVGNARKLNPSEYTYNARLGFISLRQALNNAEVLAVAYEYTLNGNTYQVGTLSQDGFAAPQALVLKLLKSSITQVKLSNGEPSQLWDNMMKNVYNLGSFGVNRENFRLDIWYNNPSSGVDMNYIPREPIEGQLLLQVMNMDKVDINNMPYSDGIFDFIDFAATAGGTIDAATGRIYMPTVEPFGEHLAQIFRDGIPNPIEAETVINQVCFQPLYDSTKTAAQQIPSLNRFKLKGQYQSASSSDISLNALNIPQGSVTVTAGGIKLVEGQQYTVDYNLGRVKIIDEGVLSSGQPIKVSLESNSMFNLQYKTLLGTRFDYTLNDKLKFGGTALNLIERPVTQKVNIGDEPVNNVILGADMAYQTKSPFITQLVDAIPLIETSKESSIDFSAEAAYLIPGHSRAISKDGNAYLDDFEGSQSFIDIRTMTQWFLASTPKLQNQGGDALFPEGGLDNNLAYGYNRAKTSWYVIDPTVFFNTNGLTPPNVDADMRSDHRMREVPESEVFPNRQLPPGVPPNIATLDVSFYPSERGQYNYEEPTGSATSAGLNPDGTLADPASRWGGIQRSLNTTDFEAANIEFIQFWVMDPFNDDSENINGGDLYFNLGNVSEDILNDTHLSFENGLPTDNNPLPVLADTWGLYPDPSTFNVVNAFDNSTGSYAQQDIGLDGLNDAGEGTYFTDWLASLQGFLDADAYDAYSKDPSADNFMYFRGSEQDSAELDVLERYKHYNGNQGNSNTSAPDGYPITATTIPNTEDINQDITLNLIESYFQYKVSMRPNDLGEGNIGENYITDSFETYAPTDNGETRAIRWYQFKIPVREFESKYGGISDFRSIRYIRMFMKGFTEPVTLRFARLELVRGEWRKYVGNMEGPDEIEPDDDAVTQFNIAAVNIEENGERDPIPYMVPPGIQREQDVATQNLRVLNEQSLSMMVCNLKDGDARAAYRNVNFDMRQYQTLKMYAHAEALGSEADLTDKDITVFVRLGADFDQNYYEYELPMTLTPWYSGLDYEVWPEANDFEIDLEALQNLKITRSSDWPISQEFIKDEGSARIKIKGNPNLSSVVTVMIGIRNPDKDANYFESNDNGKDVCAIVWVNELRLSDFREDGGGAAVARMNATLADFGTFAVAGNISKPGWGALEERVQERQQESILGLDVNSTLQMGKFFPENWGVQLPMYLGYNETVSTPKYSPLQPDLILADVPNTSQIKNKSQDFTKRRSINFSGVRISPKGKAPGDEKDSGEKPADKGDKGEEGKGSEDKGSKGSSDKPHFYDIDNFSVSYSYNEEYHSDIDIDYRLNKRYRGNFDYMFNNKPKEVKPFAKIGFVKNSPYLKWVKDFNFYPGIKSFGFNSGMDRMYETSRIRNNTLELFGVYSDMLIKTQVLKSWNWGRQYTFKYDITKSLKVDFTAANVALVGEPQGVIQKDDADWYQMYKDSVWSSITSFGTTTGYNHQANANYKLPLDKFPLIDFVSSDVRYASTYRWDRAPFSQDTLGNIIQNSRNIQWNATANMETLYNKVPLLKEINTGKAKKDDKKKTDNSEKDGFGNDEKEKKEKAAPFNPLHAALRLMMLVRNANVSYARNEGLLLPGYGEETYILGMNPDFEAPGWGFVFGEQNTDLLGRPTGRNFAMHAAESGWLLNAPYLNQQYAETYAETWNFKVNLEPIKSFKVELTGNRQESHNNSSFFRVDDETGEYVFDSPTEVGNFTASIITWGTAFEKDDPERAYNSDVFEDFLFYRLTTSARMNEATYDEPDRLPNGYYAGWGPTSQNVVIPAFIAAYSGKNPNDVPLDPFNTKMQPNWRITYDGLTKLPTVKKYFKQFNITHTYRSTVTASYVTNMSYTENEQGLPTSVDQNEFPNYIPQHQISTVTISEQLAPLLGFDMTIKTAKNNDPQVKLEFKRDRTVGLGLTNFQITETKSNSIVVGLGYKITEVPNPFGRKKGSKLPIKILDETSINIRCDVTMRDNITLIRRIEERTNQATAGQRQWSIKTSADMQVSDKLTIRFFYDQQLNKPKISTSFPTSNISSGISLRFSLNG